MCRHRRSGGLSRDAYFHNIEPHERGDHDGPGCPSDLYGPSPALTTPAELDLKDDPLAFDVPELNEGLLGDVNSMLKCVKSISKKEAKRLMGRDVRRRTCLG